MFSEKKWNVSGLKTLIKKTNNTGTINGLRGSGCLQHALECWSYLIMLLTEVRDMLVHHTVCHCDSVAFLLGKLW